MSAKKRVPESVLVAVRACPVCGTKSREVLFPIVNNNWRQMEQVTAVRCQKCQMIYFDPDISAKAQREYYSKLYFVAPSDDKCSGYPNYVDSEHLESKKYFGRILKTWIKRITPRANSLLDVGCAVGAMSRPFQEAGWKVVGVDVGCWAVDWGRKHYGLDLRCKSILDLGDEEHFDVILFWDVFEHFKNPREILAKAKELLNPGGVMIFQIPDVSKFRNDPEHYLWSTYQHSCFYTRETFANLVDLAGLSMLKRFPSTQEYEMVFIVGKEVG